MSGTLFALHPTAPEGTPGPASAPVRLLHPALLALFATALLQDDLGQRQRGHQRPVLPHLGDTGRAGLVWGAMAVTSALTGLAITMRPPAAELTLQLRLAIVAQTLLLLPLLLSSTASSAPPRPIAAIGFAVAPHLIAVFTSPNR